MNHGTAIRIDQNMYKAAKKASKAQGRSMQSQVEFWAKVGRSAIDNPELPGGLIVELLSNNWEDDSDTVPFKPRKQ